MGRLLEETPNRVPISTVLIVIVSMAMLGLNPDNARQIFSDSLATTIDVIEQGSVSRPAAMLLLAAWAIYTLVNSERLESRFRASVAIPLIALVIVMAASLIWAIDPSHTLRRLILTSLLLFASYVLARVCALHDLAYLTLAVMSIFVVMGVVAQIALGPFEPFNGEWRMAGLFPPVTLSWYCCLGGIAAVYFILRRRERRGFYVGLVVFFAIVLLLTRTRTSVAALVVGVLVLLFLNWAESRRRLIAGTLLAIGLSLFGVIVGGALGLTWSSAYDDIVEATSLGRPDAVNQIATFTGRIPVWETSIALVEQRPWLGYGFNAFSSPELSPLFAATSGWVPTSAHSGYVDALLSLGAIGFTLLILLIAGSLWTSYRIAASRATYSFAAAVLTWLVVNLFVESAVFFESNFVVLVTYAILIQVAFFAPNQHIDINLSDTPNARLTAA